MVWAVIGVAFVLLQLYVYSAWILSDDFRPTPVGPDPIPAISRWGLRVYEVLSLVTLAVVLPWFIMGIRRTGRIDATRLFMIGWLSAYWLDPFLSFLRPMFTYNAYAFNRGCWCEFIPFWQTPNGARIAEPLLIDAPNYFISFASTALVALWAMKTARRRWPTIGNWGLGLVGFAGVWFSMGLLDIGMTRIFHFDAWAGSFQAWSFWGGEFYQFPIYEFVLFPSTFVACAFLLFYADASGQTAIEKGVEQVPGPGWMKTAARVLAFIAFCNVLNLTYTSAMGVHALYADDWPANMPSWLSNEQCGPSTGVVCPAGTD
ncbi:spirocyclase AveC family protein [Rhizobium sp. CRIBSB]|nr:spirocyclase AveC family protein [Rhizobium sp. CRIBSB]